jgi:cytochrome P450
MPEIPFWEPLSEEALEDQRRTYDRMRAACPVARSPRGVTLFRHADVLAAARDPATFSSEVSAHRQVPNGLDPPEHAAFRAAIDPFFTPDRMRALEPRLRVTAHDTVSALPRHCAVDVVADFGYRFAVAAQSEWLGWQGAEAELLAWMHENHASTRSSERSRLAATAAAFDRIVSTQVERRRRLGPAAPDDPTTELLSVCVDGATLSDGDIVSILRNWTAGDLGSIAASLGVVICFLASHPEVQASLRAGSSDVARAIDEMLRIDDPFLVNRRVTRAPVEVAGFSLEPGTRVYLNWTSANRDEAVFGEPDAYRPDEHASKNLVYGEGIHVCPGRPLATLEMVVAVEALLRQTTNIALATEPRSERETYPVGGWRHLFVVLT